MWHDGGIGWGGWVVMTAMMLVFSGLLIVGGVALWGVLRRDGKTARRDGERHSEDDADRILDERFARGEVDFDDYQRRRELMRSGR